MERVVRKKKTLQGREVNNESGKEGRAEVRNSDSPEDVHMAVTEWMVQY